MRFTTTIRTLVAMTVAALLLPGLMLAQSMTTGAINGTVTDATGAVVPNITVKLTSLDRGFTREAKTNAQGVFQFPLADLGSYQLEVNVPGRGGYLGKVLVNGGQTTNVIAKLGAPGATIEQSGGPKAGTVQIGGSAPASTIMIGGGAPKTITEFLIGGTFAASLDSKKKKPGEEVAVKTISDLHLPDGTIIPRGAKVIGHVTEAKARSGGDPQSSLGIVFDKVELKDKTLAITAVIRAVGPPHETQGGGGVDYGGLNQTVQHTSAGTNWGATQGLNGDSVGVQGIKGLELSSDGVLKSGDKAVKLDSGSQVILKAQLGGN